METRCVSFRFRRALGCRGGKKRGTRLISGTTRARHDTRCADLKKSSFCASKKRGGNVPPASFGALLFLDFSAPFKVARTKFIGCCCCCSCRFKDDDDSAIPGTDFKADTMMN